VLDQDERGGQAAAGQLLAHPADLRQVQAEPACADGRGRAVQAGRGERLQVRAREHVQPVHPHRVGEQYVVGQVARGREDALRRHHCGDRPAAGWSGILSSAIPQR